MNELKEAVYTSLGEVSGLFMSQPIKGTDIIMPAKELNKIGDYLMQLIETYTNKAINNARSKDPMKCEFGHEVYAHNTADGWCCACEADIAFLNAEIKRKELEAECRGRTDELVKLSDWGKTIDDQWNDHFRSRLNTITQLSTELTNKEMK